jgi:hypothetical protein
MNCNGTLKTDCNLNLLSDTNHNHHGELEKINNQEFIEKMKKERCLLLNSQVI